MERRNDIEKELSEIAPELGKNRTGAIPYRVPEGYFAHFSEGLMRRIHRESGSGLLAQADATGFADDVSADDPRAELASISPLLAGLDRKTPYRAPDLYFEAFRADTGEAYAPPPALPAATEKARRIPFRSSVFLRYAAAAVIAVAVATAGFFALHRSSTDPLMALTKVSDQDMANYLESHDVHWVPGTAAAATATSADFSDNDISDLLSNISDTELEQYLPDLPG